jgi:hypothetical protein
MRLDSAKHSKFRSQNLKVKDQLEDHGVDESTILKWTITKYGWRAWTKFMTRYNDQWRALMNAAMNIYIPQKA